MIKTAPVLKSSAPVIGNNVQIKSNSQAQAIYSGIKYTWSENSCMGVAV